MSNIIAGITRGKVSYLDEHIAQKKTIYEHYKEGFIDISITMNSFDESIPDYLLSCAVIDEDAMSPLFGESGVNCGNTLGGDSSSDEILDVLGFYRAGGRPFRKPMHHMQPIYRSNAIATRKGDGRGLSNAYIADHSTDVCADLFGRGLCLSSDNKMT